MATRKNGRPVSSQETGVEVSGSVTVNPLANDIIADTGPLVAGFYIIQALLDTTVAARFVIEHRNAANTTNISFQRVALSADSFDAPTYGNKIFLQQDERIRIIMNSGVTGSVQTTIIYSKIAD